MEGNNIIEVRGLCKSFGNLQVLNDISTDFKENQVVSIIGPSGGGKSTQRKSTSTSTGRR